jgi:hypothetical protein
VLVVPGPKDAGSAGGELRPWHCPQQGEGSSPQAGICRLGSLRQASSFSSSLLSVQVLEDP